MTRMSAKRKGAPTPMALGFRALRGGAAVVGVAVEDRELRVVLSSFLATAAAGDRLSFEPYHVAAEMAGGSRGGASAEAAAAVAEGRERQDALAAKGLDDIVRNLRNEGYEPIVASLLVNRAGWISDLLAYSLSWPDHLPVAEGLAVRDALRFAFDQRRVPVVEVDEKTLPEAASRQFGIAPDDLDLRLKALGASVGRPWRKEQKLACLAAWVTVPAP